MIKRLRVRNLAVVEEAEIEFGPGLNVVTGETGAGKSVLIGALGLVLGGRADASVVREGAKEAEVEAVFGGDGGPEVSIRRTVTSQGRSRAWVDDESVSVAELKERCASLVDMHGPHENRRLAEPRFQLDTLDAFGGIEFPEYAKAYGKLAGLRSERDALLTSGGADEEDMLRFQVGELDEAGLSESDETVAERHAAAAHAEEILRGAGEITEALGGDGGAAQTLASLLPKFAAVARHLPVASEWAAEAEEITVRIQELSRTVADAVCGIADGDEDLETLDRRLSELNRLKRKYLARPGEEQTVARLMEILAEKKARLDAMENRSALLEKLDRDVSAAEAEVKKAGSALSKRRVAAAGRMATAMTAELRELGFDKATFSVSVERAEPDPSGMDSVVYMFGPNPGEAEHPLADIASSGELARVMLALKVVSSGGASRKSGPETLVFDEIDANIGGETGRIVGGKMRAVAAHHQVVAITHLPQSAVYGEHHFVVSKTVSGGRTRTSVSKVSGDARVSEVARMLGGERLTSVARKHAQELLEISG